MKIFEQSKAKIKARESVFRFLLTAFFLPLIFLLQLSDALAAPSFGPNMLVSEDVGPFDSSADGPPILDVDIASGVYVAWIDHRNSQTEVFFSKLTPGGSGFSSNKPLTGINNIKSFPQIEEDNGSIYVAWDERRLINNTIYQGIFFTKSTDGGLTFSEEIFIDSNDSLPISMIAHNNKILIAYSKGGNQIWLASSIDGGSTFATSIVSDATDFLRHRPSVDFKNNNVYVSWYDERSGLGDVFFAKSIDGGATFGPNKSIYTNPDSAMHRIGPYFGRLLLKVSPEGQIYIAFDYFLGQDPSNFDFDVFFIKSQNEGETFSNALRLPDDPVSNRKRQINPSLTILPDGSPVVAWFDERDAGSTKAMLSYSQDKGQTFSTNLNISNTPSPNTVYTAPTIASDGEGKIHFVRGATILSQVGVWYTKIDLGIPLDIPPTPSPSPSPTPTPAPFLDLPWDYEGKGFKDEAINIYSFFDHRYPLIFTEPQGAKGKTLTYTGIEESELVKRYSGHNGYDYPLPEGTPVLAPADGTASYKPDVNGGETIIIYHNNGFFTWYMHLQKDSTLVKSGGQPRDVTKGQQIGLSGNTGKNTTGPHLHVSVIKDINGNGKLDFGTDYPYGLIDPYGWKGDGQNGTLGDDPWPAFGGTESTYLWIHPLEPSAGSLSSTGGTITTDQATLNFSNDAARPDLTYLIDEQPASNASENTRGVSHTFDINFFDLLGQPVSNFTQFFKFVIDYSSFNLTNIIEETVSLYWFNPDTLTWEKVSTELDLANNTATAQLNHASLFALMGEVKDLISPTTQISLTGDNGQDNWYGSDVSVSLNVQDNENGVGVNDTYYSIGNDIDWQLYTQPLIFTDEGTYTVFVHSIDKGGNVETPHSITFSIDKTPPEVNIRFNPDALSTEVIGLDDNGPTEVSVEDIKKRQQQITVKDKAGNTLTIVGKYEENDRNTNINVETLSYNNNSPIELDRSRLFIEHNIDKKEDDLKTLIQRWFVKDDIKIRIVYKKKTNQSTIFIKEQGQERQKEVRDGLTLLQIITNKGKLEYSY